jgi:hypothetical protein
VLEMLGKDILSEVLQVKDDKSITHICPVNDLFVLFTLFMKEKVLPKWKTICL